MSRWKCSVIVIVSVLVAGLSGVFAQEVPVKPVPTGLAPAGVLKHVPAGCMGFVVVNDVQKFTDKINGFIKQISPPEQPIVPGEILDMIRSAAKLSKGEIGDANLFSPFLPIIPISISVNRQFVNRKIG